MHGGALFFLGQKKILCYSKKKRKMTTVGIISYNIHCVPVTGGCPTGHLDTVAYYVSRLASEHDASIIVLNELFVERARTSMLYRLRKSGVELADDSSC